MVVSYHRHQRVSSGRPAGRKTWAFPRDPQCPRPRPLRRSGGRRPPIPAGQAALRRAGLAWNHLEGNGRVRFVRQGTVPQQEAQNRHERLDAHPRHRVQAVTGRGTEMQGMPRDRHRSAQRRRAPDPRPRRRADALLRRGARAPHALPEVRQALQGEASVRDEPQGPRLKGVRVAHRLGAGERIDHGRRGEARRRLAGGQGRREARPVG